MKANGADSRILDMLLTHPNLREEVAEFAVEVLRLALSMPEIRVQVAQYVTGAEIIEILGPVQSRQNEDASLPKPSIGRQQITAREAASMLRYHHRYFTRKAKDWGLTKIKMSRTSARYYLDEVEQLVTERAIKGRIEA